MPSWKAKKPGETDARKSTARTFAGGWPTVTHEPGLSTAYENSGAIFRRVSGDFVRQVFITTRTHPFFSAENVALQMPLEAGARHERQLEGIGSMP
jgi:hypothetical protein